MRTMGLDVPLHIKNATLVGNVLGGLIFGVGIADRGKATLPTLSGHSPWWFIVGMLIVSIGGFVMLECWELKNNSAGWKVSLFGK